MMRPAADESMAATLSLDQAASEPWDVVVAGAGPAGALCAYLLARQGLAVLLIDKSAFPRNKVCGSCLNGAALAALQVAGLADLPVLLGGLPLRALHLRAAHRQATIPLPVGMALSRLALDAALVRAAVAAGAAFLPRTEATLEPPSDSGNSQPSATAKRREIKVRSDGQAKSVSGQIAVAADGLGGGFLKAIGTMGWAVAAHAPLGAGAVIDDNSANYSPGTIFMACAPAGYVGLVRLEDGRLDVAMALDRGKSQTAGGTAVAALSILEASGLPRPAALAAATLRGTSYLTRRRARVASDGLLVIGDAAGYVEPLTGEGMAWAMQQAILAAPLISAAIVRSDLCYARQWQRQYERLFRYRRGVCRAASWLRRNYNVGTLALGLLARLPGLAAPWVRAVNRPARQIQQLHQVSLSHPLHRNSTP
jgi:menaquinone-9 beta-reductase